MKEERAEKVSSLHIDDLKDALEEMGSEQVEEERKTFTITGVQDPSSGEMVEYSAALDSGLVNEKKGMYVNPLTGEEISIPEALNQGIIVGQLRSATKKEVMMGAYKTTGEVSVNSQLLRSCVSLQLSFHFENNFRVVLIG